MFKNFEFILPPGLNDRGRIRKLLVDNAGKEKLRRAGDRGTSEQDMVLLDPGQIKDAHGFKGMAVDVRFITNSVAAGVLERCSDYVVTPSDPIPLAYKVSFPSRRHAAHTNYTEEDDFAIFCFIVNKIPEYTRKGKTVPVRGNKIWMEAEAKDIAAPHTHESMRTRWMKFIEPRYQEFAARLAEEKKRARRAATNTAESGSSQGIGQREGDHGRGIPERERRGRPAAKRRRGSEAPVMPFDSRRLSESFLSFREDDVSVESARSTVVEERQPRRARGQASGGDSQQSGAGTSDELWEGSVFVDAEEPVIKLRTEEDRQEASSASFSSSSTYESIICDTPPEGMVGEGGGPGARHEPLESGVPLRRGEDGNHCGRSKSTLVPGLGKRTQKRPYRSESDFVPRANELIAFMERVETENDFKAQWVADILEWEEGSSRRTMEIARALREVAEELEVPQSVVMRVYAYIGNVGRTQERVEAIQALQEKTGVRYEWVLSWMEAEGFDEEKVEKYIGRYSSD
ncbi:hypothetical protein Pmar_PMAR017639 [Perkinsus marinus ATCC 50983]|uniref:TERF2-interacting telomeric protein 1 Myb domain-containing protein n=1 Tax=Perkinsus marinus (strain ATCC 50983 / TXsc) TaxID=423536 RepID=C5L3K7_PERM5|nr:hypothetical protein Pmar_PMAR017639 [Perkinsus marinus ATCC 50983]EER08586.1 hypothetical protein Pmar_PMAR017639 [Perkinsus marinus ATCC 50983]|eukprot:XP_002776770.1 hypothetical protein Pmar_PMAR017639 [Perkinsus marinus ATCC 50983]